MTTEYVCSACGHTFRTDDQPADGCPACGADPGRLWSVGVRGNSQRPRVEQPRPVASPLVEATEDSLSGPGTEAPRKRRRLWTLRWPSIAWRVPGIAARLPAWRRPAGHLPRPSRRMLLLALVLALWPFPLDDDRLPTPGPNGSMAGVEPPAATAMVSIADMLKQSAPQPPAAAGASAPISDRTAPRAPAAGPGRPEPATAAPPGRSTPVRPAAPPQTALAGIETGSTGAGSAGAGSPGSGRSGSGGSGSGGSGSGGAGSGDRGGPQDTPAEGQASCLDADDRRLVFLIDVSVSMGLPHGTAPEIENALDDAVHRGDAEALARYRALLASAGSASRLDLARNAFAQALEVTPPGIEVGVVSFHGCRDIRRLAPVARPGFPELLANVGDLTWHRGGETALSEALQDAYAMAGDRAGRIAVITDGKDTCGPPPCEIIGGLQRSRPGIRIDVVDVSGRSDAACLALATGGTFRVAPLTGSAEAFVDSVRALGQACPAPR